jgi:hypothetical protein
MQFLENSGLGFRMFMDIHALEICQGIRVEAFAKLSLVIKDNGPSKKEAVVNMPN